MASRRPIADYAADDVWKRQTDAVRETLRHDFERVTLLADSLHVGRTQAGGFDGIALFDNYVAPDTWRLHADNCTARDLLFSFQVNPGFDSIVFPHPEPDTCYKPPAFSPGGGVYDWTRAGDRAAAQDASRARIAESFKTTVGLQTIRGAVEREARVLPRVHQFVQRVARRASVRADEGSVGLEQSGTRARLSQSRQRPLPSRHATRPDAEPIDCRNESVVRRQNVGRERLRREHDGAGVTQLALMPACRLLLACRLRERAPTTTPRGSARRCRRRSAIRASRS